METGFVKFLRRDEFDLLLKEVLKRNSRQFEICFKLMAYLGLRVSDATKLKLENLNKSLTEVTYMDTKTKVIQNKMIPPFFRIELQEYIDRYRHRFIDDFLFPPLHNRISKNPHLQPSTFRNFFMKFRRKYGFDKPYHVCNNGQRLYRISTHTLKHFCLFSVYEASGHDMSFVKTFSGHKDMRHTIRYIEHEDNRTRQSEILEKAFA